ncbi:MAG: hypothetical protein ACLT9Y_01650 [Peptostreptococcus anaerobius]
MSIGLNFFLPCHGVQGEQLGLEYSLKDVEPATKDDVEKAKKVFGHGCG